MFSKILFHSFKEFFEQVQRNRLLLFILVLTLIAQALYFLSRLDQNCLNNPYLNKEVYAEVVEIAEGSEARDKQVSLVDAELGQLLLQHSELPWDKGEELKVGDVVSSRLRCKKICSPSLFSYQASLKRRGYRWFAYFLDAQPLVASSATTESFFSAIKKSLIDSLLRNFQMSDELAVLLASTIGEKQFLSNQVNDLFKNTGTSHLLVVSGYHISLVFMLSYAIFAYFFKRISFVVLRLPVIIPASAIAIVLACFYTCLVSGTQTALRAFLVLLISSFARSIGREIDPLRILIIVALLIIWFFPGAFLEPSFQLSFAAIVGIFLAVKVIKQIENEFTLSRLNKFVITSLIISLFASLFTWPIVYFWFSSFVLLSPLYNALLTSIFSFLVIALGDMALLLYYFSPELFDELIILILFITERILKFLCFIS